MKCECLTIMRITKKKKFRAKVLIMISGLHKLRMMRIHSNLNIHILTLLPLYQHDQLCKRYNAKQYLFSTSIDGTKGKQ